MTNLVPGEKARAILERDSAVISHSYPRAHPLVMARGKDCRVWDVDGNEFIDLAAGIAVCTTGHSHPKVVQAIKDQADKFLHISSDFYHQKWVEFSERVAALAPFDGPGRVFLGNSGTEAVEAAIKLARHHTGRQQFIAFYGAFHGRTIGALAFTASKTVYRSGFTPLMNGVSHAPYPNPYRPILRLDGLDYGEAVVEYIEDVLLRHVVPPEDCAGILVEPIQGEGGYVVPPDSFFPRLRELCDRHGILLIADEVQSGVGRTGKMWAIEHWGVEPDIVTSAKGLASGVPIGATIAKREIMDWPTGAHGNTFGGNPIACAAGLATLDLVQDELMENASREGEYILDALAEIAARHRTIGDVRGKGLMIGVEFVRDKDTRERAPELRDRISRIAFQKGLLTMGCGPSSIRIAPPLTIDRPTADQALHLLEEAISEAESEHDG